MDAQQSKQKAEARRLELGRQQLVRIKHSIDMAINIPAEETVFFETITPENLSILDEAGYSLRKEGGRLGEYSYRISWSGGTELKEDPFDTTYYPGGMSTEHPPL